MDRTKPMEREERAGKEGPMTSQDEAVPTRTDGAAQDDDRRLSIKDRVLFTLLTIAFGAFAGAFTWLFFFLMNGGIHFLWDTVPEALEAAGLPALFYPLPFCLIGGVVVGLFQKRYGPCPDDMNTVMAEVKRTGRYEYDRADISFVGAILPLLFGGSLGPEAGITGVIAGLCTWVGDRLKFVGKQMRELSTASTAAVISAIFAAPLFGLFAPLAGYVDESSGQASPFEPETIEIPRAKKVIIYLLAIAGGLGAMTGLGILFGGGLTLPHFSDIACGKTELLWAVPIAVLGAVAGWLYHASGALVKRIAHALGERPVLKAVIAGAFLGCCGIVLPYTMFAGEEQSQILADSWMTLGAVTLLLTGFLKVLTTQACLGLGWRGGHFFPLIFAGISIGYGCAALTGADPVFCLCVATAALLGAVMRQPLMTVLLLFLCFPIRGVLFMLAAAALGSIVPVPRKWLAEKAERTAAKDRGSSEA